MLASPLSTLAHPSPHTVPFFRSLESICFSILIGISCDFVIHFGHAYSILPGDRNRNERSKYALLRMGPSILAGAFTTIASATVMLFCVITFFKKFAIILFYTIIMSTAGSFIVFLTLTDALGPSEPTVFVDWMVEKANAKCKAGCRREKHDTRHIEITSHGESEAEVTC
jgi:predicted RND superfamily exporter protein